MAAGLSPAAAAMSRVVVAWKPRSANSVAAESRMRRGPAGNWYRPNSRARAAVVPSAAQVSGPLTVSVGGAPLLATWDRPFPGPPLLRQTVPGQAEKARGKEVVSSPAVSADVR